MTTLLKDPPLVRDSAASVPPLISVAEYHRRISSGELGKNDKVELIRGELVPKMPKKPFHVTAGDALADRLRELLPSGWYPRFESPITLADSEPEPDVVVARGRRSDYTKRHPHSIDVCLVVEVSNSSLRLDRDRKRPLYAENGIPCYWIVNLLDFQIEVFDDPADGEYRNVRTYAKDEASPIIVNGTEIGRVTLTELLG